MMKTYPGLFVGLMLVCISMVSRLPGQTTQPDQKSLSLVTDGIVTDQLGKPIAGATVQVVRRGWGKLGDDAPPMEIVKSMTSDDGGRFHLDISLPTDFSKGYYLLRAMKQDRGMGSLGIDTSGGKKHFFDSLRQSSQEKPWLIMMPAQTIRGVVMDDQDHPVAGCQITVELADPITTGSDGRFEFQNVPDFGDSQLSNLVDVCFWHPDFVAYHIRIPYDEDQVEHQADGSWKVVLQHGILVSGTMTDADTGQPLPGTGVSCWAQTGGLGGFHGTANADDKGHYSLHIPAASMVSFNPFVSHAPNSPNDAYAPTQNDIRENLQGAADTLQKDFTFRKGQTVSGKVTTEGPADLSVVYVSLMVRDNKIPTRVGGAQCKKDGTFKIAPVLAGSYTLEAQMTGNHSVLRSSTATAPVDVTEGQDTTGIELPIQITDVPANRPTLHGLVLNTDGTPAVLAILHLRSNDHERRDDAIYTGLDGSFEIPGIDALDNQTLWVCSADRSGAANVDFSNGVDASTPLMVQLSPTWQISGKAFDDDNKPMSGVRIALADVMQEGRMESHRPLAWTFTDANGNYTLRGFVPPKVTDNLKLEAMISYRPNRMERDTGHNIGDDLKSDHSLKGYNFRITQTDSSVKIEPERDQ